MRAFGRHSLPPGRPFIVRHHSHVSLSAIILIVLASACFTTVDVTVKVLSQRYDVPMIVWARWSVQALLILALLGPTMKLRLLYTKRLPMHLVRGVVLIGSSVCFFSAL